jgi:hypothetical protein
MKIEVQNFQKSINESKFTLAQVAMIWDFYVTKSIAKTASQGRTVKDYGLTTLPWLKMQEEAGITKDNIQNIAGKFN